MTIFLRSILFDTSLAWSSNSKYRFYLLSSDILRNNSLILQDTFFRFDILLKYFLVSAKVWNIGNLFTF